MVDIVVVMLVVERVVMVVVKVVCVVVVKVASVVVVMVVVKTGDCKCCESGG